MMAAAGDDGLVLRSAQVPETAHVRRLDEARFELRASHLLLLDNSNDDGLAKVQGFGALYVALNHGPIKVLTASALTALMDACGRRTSTHCLIQA